MIIKLKNKREIFPRLTLSLFYQLSVRFNFRQGLSLSFTSRVHATARWRCRAAQAPHSSSKTRRRDKLRSSPAGPASEPSRLLTLARCALSAVAAAMLREAATLGEPRCPTRTTWSPSTVRPPPSSPGRSSRSSVISTRGSPITCLNPGAPMISLPLPPPSLGSSLLVAQSSQPLLGYYTVRFGRAWPRNPSELEIT